MRWRVCCCGPVSSSAAATSGDDTRLSRVDTFTSSTNCLLSASSVSEREDRRGDARLPKLMYPAASDGPESVRHAK